MVFRADEFLGAGGGGRQFISTGSRTRTDYELQAHHLYRRLQHQRGRKKKTQSNLSLQTAQPWLLTTSVFLAAAIITPICASDICDAKKKKRGREVRAIYCIPMLYVLLCRSPLPPLYPHTLELCFWFSSCVVSLCS